MSEGRFLRLVGPKAQPPGTGALVTISAHLLPFNDVALDRRFDTRNRCFGCKPFHHNNCT